MKNNANRKNKKSTKVRYSDVVVRDSKTITYPFPSIPRELTDTADTIRIHDIISDSALIELKYSDTFVDRNNAGSTSGSWRYRANSAFDPDPIVGSGAVSGFVEWSAFYSTYRILGIGYNVTICNQETFPLVVNLVPSTLDLGANAASSPQFGEGRFGQEKLISAKGGQDKATMTGYVNMSDLVGKSYLFDAAFNSGTGTNPAAQTYINIGMHSGGTNLVLGVSASVVLTYHCLFYRKNSIFS